MRSQVCFISTGRPDNVAAMQSLIEPGRWYVRPGEAEAYLRSGAAEAKEVLGGLVAARNEALEDCVQAGDVCFQLSDDMKKLSRLDWGEAKPAEWGFVKAEILQHFTDYPDFKLAGVAPTDNPFYASERVKFKAFIVGDLCGIQPDTELRFDPVFKLKEDYDFTCQNIHRYGGVLRLDWVLASFTHRTNPGGAVQDRTAAVEQEMIANLKWKWPQWIKDNPRRPNEILLQFERKQREVLT